VKDYELAFKFCSQIQLALLHHGAAREVYFEQPLLALALIERNITRIEIESNITAAAAAAAAEAAAGANAEVTTAAAAAAAATTAAAAATANDDLADATDRGLHSSTSQLISVCLH